eukprot:CAMPEP_0180376526 /NCGR_PEP_ID=MMETSP0989-20121125/23471_1 /TAXON_ID=697907 /ORGANISM="non described non described, Strain CCMP2293" /LENGTH=48 /DNA_ID= /DNA_START= /DNA_END= /DNA_ORIENTATION=
MPAPLPPPDCAAMSCISCMLRATKVMLSIASPSCPACICGNIPDSCDI